MPRKRDNAITPPQHGGSEAEHRIIAGSILHRQCVPFWQHGCNGCLTPHNCYRQHQPRPLPLRRLPPLSQHLPSRLQKAHLR